MKQNDNSAIDVQKVKAMKLLSKSDQDKIQNLYNQLYEQRQNYYINWEVRRITEKFNSTATKAYMCLSKDGLYPISKVLIDQNGINYRVIDRHLKKLKNMSNERAEYLTILKLFKPITVNNILYSIITDKVFLNLLDEVYNDENDVKFVVYNRGTSDIPRNKTDSNVPAELICFIDGMAIVG